MRRNLVGMAVGLLLVSPALADVLGPTSRYEIQNGVATSLPASSVDYSNVRAGLVNGKTMNALWTFELPDLGGQALAGADLTLAFRRETAGAEDDRRRRNPSRFRRQQRLAQSQRLDPHPATVPR